MIPAAFIFASDILGGVWSFRTGGAMVVMRGYFDDSGTHADSEIAVWGGWLATDHQWAKVERRWATTLTERGLESFHMADCMGSRGDYGNRADRDHLVHLLRTIIIEEELTGIAADVVCAAWRKAPPWLQDNNLDPARAAAAFCVSFAVEKVEKIRHRMTVPLALFFDQGALSGDICKGMIDNFNEKFGTLDSVSFLPVKRSPALQAADMLAWEIYRDAQNYERDGTARKWSAHFQRLVEANHMDVYSMNQQSVDQMWAKGAPPHWKEKI